MRYHFPLEHPQLLSLPFGQGGLVLDAALHLELDFGIELQKEVEVEAVLIDSFDKIDEGRRSHEGSQVFGDEEVGHLFLVLHHFLELLLWVSEMYL
jgi:hypothetical protein